MIGFNGDEKDVIIFLCNDLDDCGIFIFDDLDKKKNIDKLSFNGTKNEEDKKIELISYLLELAYDLLCLPRR